MQREFVTSTAGVGALWVDMQVVICVSTKESLKYVGNLK